LLRAIERKPVASLVEFGLYPPRFLKSSLAAATKGEMGWILAVNGEKNSQCGENRGLLGGSS